MSRSYPENSSIQSQPHFAGTEKPNAIDPMLLYKLSVLVMMRLGSAGSYGDVAASSYGGYIYYRSPDREWLQEALNRYSVKELVSLSWPGLHIEPLPPLDATILVGWTGSPASTEGKVTRLHDKVAANPDPFHEFLNRANDIVEGVHEAWHLEKTEDILEGIDQYGALLRQLDHAYDQQIVTDRLQTLIDLAHHDSFAAKSSGAGGGDCGIAVGLPDLDPTAQQIEAAWKANGILPLSVHLGARYIIESRSK